MRHRNVLPHVHANTCISKKVRQKFSLPTHKTQFAKLLILVVFLFKQIADLHLNDWDTNAWCAHSTFVCVSIWFYRNDANNTFFQLYHLILLKHIEFSRRSQATLTSLIVLCHHFNVPHFACWRPVKYQMFISLVLLSILIKINKHPFRN